VRGLPIPPGLGARGLLIPPGLGARGLLIPPELGARELLIPPELENTGLLIPPELEAMGLPIPPELGVRGLPIPPELGVRGLSIPPELGARGLLIPPELGARGLLIPPELGARGLANLTNIEDTTMDSKTLEQFKEEIQKEFCRMMSNSNVGEILEKYNLLENASFEMNCLFDNAEIKNVKLTETAANAEGTVKVLCDWCVPCPVNGNPRGCCCV
jgi:hypothetical protein